MKVKCFEVIPGQGQTFRQPHSCIVQHIIEKLQSGIGIVSVMVALLIAQIIIDFLEIFMSQKIIILLLFGFYIVCF